MALGKALTQITSYELDKGFAGWRTAVTGTEECPEYWAPMGLDKLALYPQPAADILLDVQYLKGDPRLTADSAYLDLGDEEITRIIDYAQWVLAFKEGVEEAAKNSEPLKQLFLQAANSRNARLKQTAAYRRYMGQARDETAPTQKVPEKLGVRG